MKVKNTLFKIKKRNSNFSNNKDENHYTSYCFPQLVQNFEVITAPHPVQYLPGLDTLPEEGSGFAEADTRVEVQIPPFPLAVNFVPLY